MTERGRKMLAPAAVIAAGVLVLGWFTVAFSQWPPEPEPWSPPTRPTNATDEPDVTAVAVLGDSYTAGSSQGGLGQSGWATRVCIRLDCGWIDYAVGGSGYTRKSKDRVTFGDQVPDVLVSEADLVILAGGANDAYAPLPKFVREVERTLDPLERGMPDADFVIFSPFYRSAPPPEIDAMTEALREIAEDRGMGFVDVSHMFEGRGAEFVGDDGVHPTDRGHAYMARQLVPELRPYIRRAGSS